MGVRPVGKSNRSQNASTSSMLTRLCLGVCISSSCVGCSTGGLGVTALMCWLLKAAAGSAADWLRTVRVSQMRHVWEFPT